MDVCTLHRGTAPLLISLPHDGIALPVAHLGYAPPGRSRLRIAAGEHPVRALLLGGEPLGEPIVMWWNFIGRDHDEIVAFRSAWQAEVIEGTAPAATFGRVEGWPGSALPAPVLPGIRLKPRS